MDQQVPSQHRPHRWIGSSLRIASTERLHCSFHLLLFLFYLGPGRLHGNEPCKIPKLGIVNFVGFPMKNKVSRTKVLTWSTKLAQMAVKLAFSADLVVSCPIRLRSNSGTAMLFTSRATIFPTLCCYYSIISYKLHSSFHLLLVFGFSCYYSIIHVYIVRSICCCFLFKCYYIVILVRTYHWRNAEKNSQNTDKNK